MKKLIAIMMLVMMVISASAQETKVYFKPVSGVTLATVTNSHAKYQVGYIGGAEFEFAVNDYASLSVGAVYAMQGCQDTNKTGIDCSIEYLNFPILVNFSPVKGLAFKAGLQPGVKLRAYAREGNVSLRMDDISTLEIAIPVGLSYEISNVVFDARYNFHVKRIGEGIKAHNSVFQFTLGYKFEL